MTTEDLMLICSMGKIFPGRYDTGGWCAFLMELNKLGMDVQEQMEHVDELPKSKKEIEAVSAMVRNKMSTPDYHKLVLLLDADKFMKLTEDKQEKEFRSFLHSVEQEDFPPYVLEIDPIVQQYIADNFKYTYTKDGKTIVYARAYGVQGTVWEEVADSEHPFSKVKGKLRAGLSETLVIRSRSKVMTVYVHKGEKQKVYEHIPYWKLHNKNLPKTMEYIRGTPDAVNLLKDKLVGWIEMMKRCHEGKLSNVEIARGLQDIPKKLVELDENIDSMTFFYHDDISFPTLTNDPNEPALAYFDLNTITEGPTPDFDGFMESIDPSCRDSLMAAIYATFFAKSRLNQYVWIHGEGGDGKSSLLNALARYAGDRLACSLGAQDMKSEFGLENCVGKRMVIMSDVKTGLTVKSGLIHNLTGHDLISINRKNKPIISVRLNPILWIAANEAPDVNFDNRNEARRCLYIKMIEPPIEIQKKFYFTKPDGTFDLDEDGDKQNNGYDLEGHLVAEMPHILYKCRESFERVCPAPYSVIKQNSEAIHLAKENCLDIDAAAFNTYIQETFSFAVKEARMEQTEIFEAITETMKNHGDRHGLNQFEKRDIRRLLTVKYGCKRMKSNGIYYLTGISRKVCDMTPVENPSTGRKVYIPPEDMKAPSVGDFV